MTKALKPIATRRLVLRPVSPADAGALHPLMTWEVVRWLSAPPWPLSFDDVASYFADVEREMLAGIPGAWTIVADGKPWGVISLTPRHGAMTLGYWLAEPQWGRGIMTEAASAVLDAFFASDAALHVTSGAFVGNAASLAVQKKLGFVVVAENTIVSRPQGRRMAHIETMVGRRSWERSLAA